MHRGSSKGGGGGRPPSETLPLSASRPVVVDLEIVRAGTTERARIEVAVGTPVRQALRAVGRSPEGCAVLVGETPIPLTTPILSPVRLTVVPTFSGG